MHQSKLSRLDKLETIGNPEKHSVTVTRRIVERSETTGKLEIVEGWRLAPGKEPEYLNKEHFAGQDVGFVDHVARDKNYAAPPANHVPVNAGRPRSDRQILNKLLESNPDLIESLRALIKNGGYDGQEE